MKPTLCLAAFLLAVFVSLCASPAGGKPKPEWLPPGVRALRDLPYARLEGNRPLALDLYLPEKPAGLVPVVVWIHGGGWVAGDKTQCPAVFLVPKGCAVASIDYRLSGSAPFPAQIHDCKGAIRWLRANSAKYGLDPNRIGAWGISSGGHLAALLGTCGDVKELEGTVGGNLTFSSRVQAVCDFFGPTDLATLGDPKVSQEMSIAVTKLLGGPADQKKELAALASPITHAGKNAPPFLIMHGEVDRLIPLAQSQALQDALKKAGADSTLVVVQRTGHEQLGSDSTAAVQAFFAMRLSAPALGFLPPTPGPTTRPAAIAASRPAGK